MLLSRLRPFPGEKIAAHPRSSSRKEQNLGLSVYYCWLFPRRAASIHHGGSGSTAAALRTGISQVICPFILDQFYWAERMFWLGVASEPLNSACLHSDKDDDTCISKAAKMLVGAINYALSPEVKLRATQIADRISNEALAAT